VLVAVIFAVPSFSGCFSGCGEPEPVVGTFLAGLALLMLALPSAAVRFVQARGPVRRAGPACSSSGLAVLGALLLLSGPAATRL
jgi:hypothetical protein